MRSCGRTFSFSAIFSGPPPTGIRRLDELENEPKLVEKLDCWENPAPKRRKSPMMFGLPIDSAPVPAAGAWANMLSAGGVVAAWSARGWPAMDGCPGCTYCGAPDGGHC